MLYPFAGSQIAILTLLSAILQQSRDSQRSSKLNNTDNNNSNKAATGADHRLANNLKLFLFAYELMISIWIILTNEFADNLQEGFAVAACVLINRHKTTMNPLLMMSTVILTYFCRRCTCNSSSTTTTTISSKSSSSSKSSGGGGGRSLNAENTYSVTSLYPSLVNNNNEDVTGFKTEDCRKTNSKVLLNSFLFSADEAEASKNIPGEQQQPDLLRTPTSVRCCQSAGGTDIAGTTRRSYHAPRIVDSSSSADENDVEATDVDFILCNNDDFARQLTGTAQHNVGHHHSSLIADGAAAADGRPLPAVADHNIAVIYGSVDDECALHCLSPSPPSSSYSSLSPLNKQSHHRLDVLRGNIKKRLLRHSPPPRKVAHFPADDHDDARTSTKTLDSASSPIARNLSDDCTSSTTMISTRHRRAPPAPPAGAIITCITTNQSSVIGPEPISLDS